MIIFLDFDGVLHPMPLPVFAGALLFDQLSELQRIVRARPSVKVVVHSSWRLISYYEDKDFADILELGGQFLGTTPREIPSRWESIRAWLKHYPGDEDFVILDDMAGSFPTEAREYLISPQAVVGMTESDWKELERILDAKAKETDSEAP